MNNKKSTLGAVNYILISSTLILLNVCASCADINRNGQQEKIKVMTIYLDSINKIVNHQKNDSLSLMNQKSTDVELRIKNNLISDTINLTLGKKMDDYKIMRKKIGRLKKNHSILKKAIIEEKSALNKLKTDINNGSGRKDKYNEYIKFEQNKLKKIKLLFKQYINNRNLIYSTYKRLHEELYEYSLSLIDKKIQ